MKTRSPWLLPLVLAWPLLATADDGPPGFRVAEGFEVAEFAGPEIANDIYRMTVDPRGRIVVAGRGYIRILADDDGDGRADRAIPFADEPRDGAMGMLWEDDSLLVVGEGGLRRLRDADGDDRADGPSELIREVKTGGEHDAHAIRRGPDGWLYLLCGNFTGIDASWATLPTSPIREPVAGCVVRFPPDFAGSEIVADGFRNAYGFDFNPDGDLFTYDSDNERCVSLPWYEPTRFYHVVPGGHHGWLAPQVTETWRLPSDLPDVVPPVATLGRGSPTGVVCYRHTQFPERYRGGFFALDWTFGRVVFLRPTPEGSTYRAEPETFLQSVGDEGFAPTDAVVHPTTGDLYISIGGRGTRGAVYRVRFRQAGPAGEPLPIRPRRLDADVDWAALAQGTDPRARLDALVNLRRHRARFGADAIRSAIRANWDASDRGLRQAAAELIATLDEAGLRPLQAAARSPRSSATLALGMTRSERGEAISLARPILADRALPEETRLAAVRALQIAFGDVGDPARKGTVWEGYTPRAGRLLGIRELPDSDRELVLATLRDVLREGPGGRLEREVLRTLGLSSDSDPSTLDRVVAGLPSDSDPLDDLHRLIVASRLTAERSAATTAHIAGALLDLDRKLDERGAQRDRNWPLRVVELHTRLAEKDPRLNEALVEHRDFGRAGHAVFARSPGIGARERGRAQHRLRRRALADPDFPWDAETVGFLVAEEREDRQVLRRLWGRAGLDAAIVMELALAPEEEDRPKYVDGLTILPLDEVSLALSALDDLDAAAIALAFLGIWPLPEGRDDAEELAALVSLLGRLRGVPGNEGLRGRVVSRLRRLTGSKLEDADPRAWAEAVARARPALAARLANPDGVDLDAWEARSKRIAWDAGEPGRGRAVFQRASCAACHSGGSAVGPDLRGVAGRFGRDELLDAVLRPGRDVPDRYRSTLVATPDGKVYQGMVIYEAVDGLILQTGASTTVRLSADQLAERRAADGSLMPAGLLDGLSDAEVADLFAYLKDLGRTESLPGAPGAGKTPR